MNISEEINVNDVTGDLTVGSTLTVDDTLNKVGINHTPTASSAALRVSGDINASGDINCGGYTIENVSVLSSSTLGSSILGSSLTSVGTLSSLSVTGDLVIDTNSLLVDSALNKVGIKHVPVAASSDFTVSGTANISGALDCGELQLPVAAPAANNSGNIYASTDKIHVYDSAWKSFSSDDIPYAHYEQDTAQACTNGGLPGTTWDSVSQRGGFVIGGSGSEHLITFPKTGLYYCSYTMAWVSNGSGDRQAWLQLDNHRYGLQMARAAVSWDALSGSCIINVTDLTKQLQLVSWQNSGATINSFVYTVNPTLHPAITIAWIGESV